MTRKFKDELEGQQAFYTDFLPLVDSNLTIEDVQIYNTDGVVNGNIVEMKLNINDLNSTLFQAIKYLSAFRIKGIPVPKYITLISLNDEKAYIYNSQDYFTEIETPYTGGASKNNTGFIGRLPTKEFDYSKDLGASELTEQLKERGWIKVNIDESNIVGWAMNYYKQNPTGSKGDFLGDSSGKVKIIGEIRKPLLLEDYIIPYTKKTNVRFQYLMGKLNDSLHKKNLGAFYTPVQYAKKALELVEKAIERVPEGNDYVILDRCAGTGNLEEQMSNEMLSRTIVSTYEYYEYKVLAERLGDKVLHIIPPIEREDTFNSGLVRGSNALSMDLMENEVIKKYVDDEKITIIIFENPPYAETTSVEWQRKSNAKLSSAWKKNYVVEQMKKEVKGTVSNDMANAFIWGGFKYFLRQPTDSMIVFAPIKYWKSQGLINKKFVKGFAFNRKHFHANIDAMISCILWYNEEEEIEDFELEAIDLNSNLEYIDDGKLSISKIHSKYSSVYFDKRKDVSDTKDGIAINLDGTEFKGNENRIRVQKLYNPNILGYMAVYGDGFDNPDLRSSLLIAGRYDANGFFLRKDNFLEKLPMFAASRYISNNRKWTERSRIMKSADGVEAFIKDVKNGKAKSFLNKCLFYTCLVSQNHMRTFEGTDGRHYRNELCLDSTNGETIASSIINASKLNLTEMKLKDLWEKILNESKKTRNYKSRSTYGVYQIETELNTSVKDDFTGNIVYHYPHLNGDIKSLKELLKVYYNNEIVPDLFKYEFLK